MAPPKKFPQIAEQIAGEIKNGTYQVGDKFPNLDEMSKFYNISRATAFRAMAILAREGYISVGRGRKSVVIRRDKSSVLQKSNHPRTIAVLADFNMDMHIGMSLKLVYLIMQELKEQGNHVVCFQYCGNIDLRSDDVDAYIVFDMLGVYCNYCERVQQTGKPYVIIDYMKDHVVRPNHLHLQYKPALMEFVCHLLANKIENYIFCLVDEKSSCKHAGEKELQRINSWINDELIKPLVDSLESHGCSKESARIRTMYLKADGSKKSYNEALRGLPPETGIIAISENHALDIVRELKSRNMHPQRDFHVVLADSVSAAKNEALQELYTIKVPFTDMMDKVVKSLDRQLTAASNFCPGGVISSSLISPEKIC